ncbi:MAG TPA: ABC transporter substrate-binding protein, partial [Nakamurella sp.]
MRPALVLVAIATLTLAACGSKSSDTTSSSSAAPAASGSAASGSAGASGSAASTGGLAIKAQVQIDVNGAEVPVTAGGTPVSPKGDGTATCSGISLAMAGPLTGASSALGINIIDGAKVAIDQHNKANPNCQVDMKPFDTEGDPQKATQVAPQIVGDASIIGLLGPAFSGVTKA